jgi:3-oxoadipate enol-lactonase
MAVELHYVEEGPKDAPALVLSGSLGSTMEMWRPQRDALSDEYRVISVDNRGHGASPVPPGPYTVADLGADVLALLDRLEIETASFCGLSLGGAIGMWLAHNAPGRLGSLVLCSTSARFGPLAAWADRARAFRDGEGATIAEGAVRRWFAPAFNTGQPDVVARMRAMIAETPAEGYAACCEALDQWDFRAHLPDLRVPTMVIAGSLDPATPPEQARMIAEGIGQARLEIVEGGAHLVTYEYPDKVNALIREHLTQRSNTSSRM